MTGRASIFAEVDQRRDWQDRNHPPRNGRDRWAVILGEWFGKVAECCVQLGRPQVRQSDIDSHFWKSNLRKRLVDVAAVAVAWIEDIDASGE